jgi:predicted metal-binding membrane protein
MAGLSQFSDWKARLLADCQTPAHDMPARLGLLEALRTGTILGLRCCLSCIGPMAALTMGGLMDLRLMAAVTTAITAERLLSAETRVADAIGVVMAAAGLLLLVQALG